MAAPLPAGYTLDAPLPKGFVLDAPAKQGGPQPSLADRFIASPLGRFAQENVVTPLLSAPSALFHALAPVSPMSRAVAQGTDAFAGAEQKGYDAALARNRNTPGYAAEREKADAMQADLGSPVKDSFTRPLNSTMAGTVGLLDGLDNSNANADAQTAADDAYSKAHPFLSGLGTLAGSLAVAPEAAAARLPPKAIKAPIPSVADLKATARTAYQAVDNSGMKIAPHAIDNLVAKTEDDLSRLGFHPKLQPKTAAAFDAFQGVADSPTLQNLETQRRIAQNAVDPMNKSDTMMSRVIVDNIDDFVKNLGKRDVVGNVDQNAVNALSDARSLWQRAAKADTVQGLIDKAATNSASMQSLDKGQALRTQFRKLANNPRGMARFSAAEQDAIRKVAQGGPLEHILRYIGKASPDHVIPAIAEAGAALSGEPHSMAIGIGSAVAGAGAKIGASAITSRNARLALELMRMGKSLPVAAAAPVLRAPIALPVRDLPKGLFGSAWYLNGQPQGSPAY